MPEKRKKKRVAATIQMYVGEDDDLIDWYRQVGKGDGNKVLKQTLRRALGLPEPEPQRTLEQEQLYYLNDQLERMKEMLTGSVPAIQSGHDNSVEIRAWVQQQLTTFAADLRRIEGMIAQVQQQQSAIQPAENGAGVSQEKLNKRQKRLRKAQW